MAYDYEALKQIWVFNGGNPAAAGIAAAVALAESGGNPNAIGHNTDGSVDRGLWQINSVHGSLSTTDITANAKAAISISNNGTNWQPWTTFKSGAYLKFLNPSDPSVVGTSSVDVKPPPDMNPLSILGSGVQGVVDNLSQVVKAGTWFSNPHNTIRIFQIVFGGIVILMGIGILARGTVDNVVSTVKTGAKVTGAI